MTFWSGETLKTRLPVLVTPYNEKNVDCASYVLHLGEQAFVTKDGLINGDSNAPLLQIVDKSPPSNTVIINTGQFAFLLTEEVVSVPKDAIALISMKSGLKNKGLVNVSGFHVDPGFSGKLIFAAYNAGPKEIILERSQALFMIVFADLDRQTEIFYDGKSQNQTSIKTSLLDGMTGQVFSPMMLQSKMADLTKEYLVQEKRLTELTGQVKNIEGKKEIGRGLMYFVIGTLLTILLGMAALDWPKVMLGYLLNDAITTYKESVLKETVVEESQPITINQHMTLDSKELKSDLLSIPEKPKHSIIKNSDAAKPTKQ